MTQNSPYLLVILESPYAGDVETNLTYARACVADSLSHGEAPIASHLLYTQPGILDDSIPRQRALGIAAGLAWYSAAQACVVYIDRGISQGMMIGMLRAEKLGITIERRTIPGWWQEG